MDLVGNIYYVSYFLLVTILTIIVCRKYANYPVQRLEWRNHHNKDVGFWMLVVVLMAAVGLRPSSSTFTDMSNYIQTYWMWEGVPFEFDPDTTNLIFDNYLRLFASVGLPIKLFFLTIAVVYFGVTAWACKRMFPNDALLAYLVFLAAFSTLSYGTNGIKAGAAAAWFLLAIAYRDKPIVSILLLAVSYGTHHSMLVVCLGYIIVNIVKNPKIYFAFWVFALLCAMAHITYFQELFARFADEQAQNYLDTSAEGYFKTESFRIDFVIYSFFPIYLGYKMVYKYRRTSVEYLRLLNLYLMINGIWMLCMYSDFTNRTAYLSWLMYPVVLVYPYLRDFVHPRQYQKVATVAYIQLGFSLFMYFVFYRIF